MNEHCPQCGGPISAFFLPCPTCAMRFETAQRSRRNWWVLVVMTLVAVLVGVAVALAEPMPVLTMPTNRAAIARAVSVDGTQVAYREGLCCPVGDQVRAGWGPSAGGVTWLPEAADAMYPRGIADTGRMVGFGYWGDSYHAWINDPGGPPSFHDDILAMDVSADGAVVVGTHVYWLGDYPVAYRNGAWEQLPTPHDKGYANDVMGSGEVVFGTATNDTGHRRPCAWDMRGGGAEFSWMPGDLSALDGQHLSLISTSPNGEWATLEAPDADYYWHAGQFREFPEVSGWQAWHGVSDDGIFVGEVYGAYGACLWHPTWDEPILLHPWLRSFGLDMLRVLAAQGWDGFDEVYDISADGRTIVGAGRVSYTVEPDMFCRERPFVIRLPQLPTPEPSSLLLLGCGVLLLRRSRAEV